MWKKDKPQGQAIQKVKVAEGAISYILFENCPFRLLNRVFFVVVELDTSMGLNNVTLQTGSLKQAKAEV